MTTECEALEQMGSSAVRTQTAGRERKNYVNLYMTVKYLVDKTGNPTDVQLSIKDYLHLLERANELPDYVKEGIKRGQEQARKGITKSTEEVMQKFTTVK
jgi:hypothetical protein